MDRVAYQKKVSDYFSAACVQMVIQLAKDVGILDILFSAEQILTSVEIADQGKLKERYVREILAALAASEVIQVDDSSTKFHIPEDHKSVLRAMSAYSKLEQLMVERMKRMKDVLTKDGPDGIRIDAAAFEAIEERRTASQDTIIDNDILPCVPDVKNLLEKGIHVAEFGCAQGIILLNLAARYPKSTFLGSDISESCLERGRTLAADRGLTNITFQVYNVLDLPDTVSDKFDWIFLRDTLHDLPSPSKALRSVKKALKKDGTASFVDFGMQGTLADHVGDIFWGRMYSVSTFFCIPESFQGEHSDAYGPCWSVETVRQLMDEAGLTLVNMVFSEKHNGAVHYVCKQ
ncbi:uncharacterized protein LOC121371378 isoform X2 [Gigantopelta aegis]|nr:uncharacterized protein LOC121371378 isoform X2 [Gigantopelta aegis]XP_041353156.1 uncharacterized protein LOC121371378 isoform X2 [Gigantopelta aegis]